MSFIKLSKEFIAERLYDACQDRSITVREAVDKFVTAAFDNILFDKEKNTKLEGLVRDYKNRGAGLDQTSEEILTLLYGDEDSLSPYDFDFPITLKNKQSDELKSVRDSLAESIKKLMDQRGP